MHESSGVTGVTAEGNGGWVKRPSVRSVEGILQPGYRDSQTVLLVARLILAITVVCLTWSGLISRPMLGAVGR